MSRQKHWRWSLRPFDRQWYLDSSTSRPLAGFTEEATGSRLTHRFVPCGLGAQCFLVHLVRLILVRQLRVLCCGRWCFGDTHHILWWGLSETSGGTV